MRLISTKKLECQFIMRIAQGQYGAVPADRAKDADLQLRWYNGFPEVLNQSIVYLSKQPENQIFQLTKAFKVSTPEIP